MKILDILDIHNLIICPNDYKKAILQELNKRKTIIDISFMSLNEYIKNYLFAYDQKAILYLMNNYKFSVANAKEILDNLIYIDDNRNYDNKKLDDLVKYKKELDNHNLLIYNPIFKSYIANKHIYIYGYGKLDDFTYSLFKKDTKVIEDKLINKKYDIYTFNNIEEEVEYLYTSIFELLKKGIDINKIAILNYNDEYLAFFKRYNSYFDFKIDINDKQSIIGTELVNKFIKMLDINTLEEIYSYLKNINNDISNKLINLINKYALYDLKDVKDLILDDIKNIKINNKYNDVVRCLNNDSYIDDNDYIFLIGFNDTYPNNKKDDEYITDNLKQLLNLPSLEKENGLLKDNKRAYLSNINNLYISYSIKTPFNTYNNQYLFNKDDVRYIKKDNTYNYSNGLNKLKYSYKLDTYLKYGLKDEDLSLLYSNYGDISYLKYDNKFKGLNNKQIKKIDNVKLSYTSMNDYYKCSFMYYLKYILNISDFKGTYYSKAGSICHGVLEDYYKDDKFDFETAWNREKNKLEEKNKEIIFNNDNELFFENKIKEELKKDIDIISDQKKLSLLDEIKCEYNDEIKINDKVIFKGQIDKILYTKGKDGYTYVLIVDYKTGKSAKINEKLFDFGLSLQLPSYLYLIKNSKEFKNVRYIGYYLQYLIASLYEYSIETLDSQKREMMKLNGYTTNNVDRASLIDSSLLSNGSSDVVKGLKLKVDGDLNTISSKLVSDAKINELIALVENKISDASSQILVGNFKINPKIIDNNNESCKYCEFSDLCFKRFNDNVYYDTKIKKDKDKDALY